MSMGKMVRKWDEIYKRNLRDGFPQLNFFPVVMKHYSLSHQLEQATLALRDTHYHPTAISRWISLYKDACREFREHHLEGYRSLEETTHSRRENRKGSRECRNPRVDIQQEKLL